MVVSGEEAGRCEVIRLDDFSTANKGVLLSADDLEGRVVWRDAAGETKEILLGPRSIRILKKR